MVNKKVNVTLHDDSAISWWLFEEAYVYYPVKKSFCYMESSFTKDPIKKFSCIAQHWHYNKKLRMSAMTTLNGNPFQNTYSWYAVKN